MALLAGTGHYYNTTDPGPQSQSPEHNPSPHGIEGSGLIIGWGMFFEPGKLLNNNWLGLALIAALPSLLPCPHSILPCPHCCLALTAALPSILPCPHCCLALTHVLPSQLPGPHTTACNNNKKNGWGKFFEPRKLFNNNWLGQVL